MFPLTCACINRWVNTREGGDSRRHRAHYDVIVMGLSVSLHLQLFHCINDYSVYALSQWETALHYNAVSHWVDAYPEWCQCHLSLAGRMHRMIPAALHLQWITLYKYVCPLFWKSYSRQQLYVCIRREIITGRPILGRKSHNWYFESDPSQPILPHILQLLQLALGLPYDWSGAIMNYMFKDVTLVHENE